MAKANNTPTDAQAQAAAPTYVAAPYSPTNVLSIVSLVTGILGFSFAPFLGSIAAVITGHIALHQIKRTQEQGRGMALAGLIMGYVVLGLFVIGTALLIFLFIVSMNSYGAGQMRGFRA